MAAITTRETGTTGVDGVTRKNAPLTNAEIDTNFINLNNAAFASGGSTDNAIVRFDGTTGKLGQNSLVTISDTGAITAPAVASVIPFYYANQAAFPSAATYHGALAHSHSDGKMYFAHGGSWNALSNASDVGPVANGGTGLTSSGGSGFLLIGNSSNTFTAATLTGTVNQIIVTNASGSITLSAPQDLATSSNPQFGSLGVGTAASGTSGEIRSTGNITSYYSDERLKTNIAIIENALDKVMQLRGVTYNANQIAESFGYINKEKQVGVIAGDVEKVLPEAVKPAPFDIMLFENTEISKSGQNYKTVQYEKLVPLLIEAIKELNNEIKQLKEIK